MSDSDKAVASTMLNNMGIKTETDTQTEMPLTQPSRRSGVSTGRARTKTTPYKPTVPRKFDRKITTADEYAHNYPHIMTPHVAQKPKMVAVLRDIMSKAFIRDDDAIIDPEDYKLMVRLMTTYFNDMMEGAGFIFKGKHDEEGAPSIRKDFHWFLKDILETDYVFRKGENHKHYKVVMKGESK
tara:strand:+ start:103 stop:651 length:549 start_codon:yes stop_codon:yes gene_type:complete